MSTALLVVDAQKIYTDPESEMHCEDALQTIRRINLLIQHAEGKGHLVVLIRHVHKSDGSDLGRLFDFDGEPAADFNFKEGSEEVEYDESLSKPPSAIELTKNRYSAFAGSRLAETLAKHGIHKITICGFMTNFCCESTARDALDRDYYVDFILDATGSPGTDKYGEQDIRQIVSELLSAGFASVRTTQEYTES